MSEFKLQIKITYSYFLVCIAHYEDRSFFNHNPKPLRGAFMRWKVRRCTLIQDTQTVPRQQPGILILKKAHFNQKQLQPPHKFCLQNNAYDGFCISMYAGKSSDDSKW